MWRDGASGTRLGSSCVAQVLRSVRDNNTRDASDGGLALTVHGSVTLNSRSLETGRTAQASRTANSIRY